MYIENDLLPVCDVEDLEGIDLDALPLLMHVHDAATTLDKLLPIEDGHDLDDLNLEVLPTIHASSRGV